MYDEIAETPIGNIKVRTPVRVLTGTPLLSVVRAMHQAGRGAAIVEDSSGNLLGIFTERHLLRQVDHDSLDWYDLSVDKVMDQAPPTIEASHFIREALGIMSRKAVRQLPMIDVDKHVIGIVSIRDILAHITGFYPSEFLNLPPGPEHEATDLHGG